MPISRGAFLFHGGTGQVIGPLLHTITARLHVALEGLFGDPEGLESSRSRCRYV